MSAGERSAAVPRVVVAVDGPSGSGKSSVSREAARRLGFGFLSTGAAYRALAWLALERGIDVEDEAAIVALLPAFLEAYEIATDPDERWIRVGSAEVGDALHGTRISGHVSSVARIPAVREAFTALFRAALFGHGDGRSGMIAEGRDITTVVAPDASARILLTADEGTRIARRAAELPGEDAALVADSISRRDRADAGNGDFLRAAPGVTVIDSTDLDFEQAVRAVMDCIARGETAS